jgi:hypothetical protein
MDETALNHSALDVGHTFAHACSKYGPGISYDYGFSLLNVQNYSGTRHTPRLTVRDQFKVVDLSARPSGFWYETSADSDVAGEISDTDTLPENVRGFGYAAEPDLHSTKAWVKVPDGLPDDCDAFASFIAVRLIPRLFTAENTALIRGQHGLLNHAEIQDLPVSGNARPADAVFDACNAVEQQGASAVGMFLNPRDYWSLRNNSDAIAQLEASGVRITRTRLCDAGKGIVGDFDFGARLFDRGSSTIRFAEPPADSRTEGQFLEAEIYERLVVGLPMVVFRFDIPSHG